MKRAAGIVLCLSLVAGCAGPKTEMLRGTHRIDDLAAGIESDMDEGLSRLAAGQSPKPQMVDAKAKAAAIRTETKAVREQMPKVVETESKWLPLIKMGLVVAGIGLVIFGLWKLGIDQVVRPLFHRLGLMISKTTKAEAKFDAEALRHPAVPPQVRERIAVRRATDPGYDREFQRQKAKLETEST